MQTNNDNVQRLVMWIDRHERPNPTVNNGDGTLTVSTECINNGVLFIERDIIPATLEAARDLLGY